MSIKTTLFAELPIRQAGALFRYTTPFVDTYVFTVFYTTTYHQGFSPMGRVKARVSGEQSWVQT